MGVLQVWRPKTAPQPVSWQEQQLYVDPELYLMGDACFAPFRLLSCQSRQFGHQGMPGRVLRSGCVQVVQNLRIIPDVLHPRSKLSEAVADEVGEVVYVPVFDTTRPHVGPVAVLEALLLARATDSMLVANFISVAGSALAALQLSLSNPLPQPVRRSRLEGRKPCPQQQQPQAGGACRKQQRWQLEQSEDEHEDADVAADCRPGKLQRTLSICRTKSVSAGLDQVLLDAAGAAVGVLQTANSC
ncbi:hypothetical protein OEZ85_009331 [Tetradesmus obliquus]|uniref:DDE Tnp4 domain-containing protein n=1 Tax=Tetradesmus obliquus TaxID=3088 RepID=A0ABY8U9G0_TETOB|nr:hypothetical protein OEZ85_009331 [Tetradesmus obliquus]